LIDGGAELVAQLAIPASALSGASKVVRREPKYCFEPRLGHWNWLLVCVIGAIPGLEILICARKERLAPQEISRKRG
jgi:hypothetical protein